MLIPNQSEIEYSFTLPDGEVITETKQSNIVNTEILTYSFTKEKSSDKDFLQEGETATQTVVLTNNSQVNITNAFFADTMSAGASYVDGSVTVGGVSEPTFDLVAGFDIGDFAPGASLTITYQITADNPRTQPLVNNYGTVNYTAEERNLSENTNTVEIALVSNRLTITKEVDKSVAVKGEKLHYTSTITNTGSLIKTNLSFTDDIPAGTTFIVDSVLVDGVAKPGLNPQNGFALDDLGVGESVVVEFDVLVN